jgi:hypothetical protein
LVKSTPNEVWFADTQREFFQQILTALRKYNIQTAEGVGVEGLNAGIEVFWPDGTPRALEDAADMLLKGNQQRISNRSHAFKRDFGVPTSQRGFGSGCRGKIIGSVSLFRDVTVTKLKELENNLKVVNQSLGSQV